MRDYLISGVPLRDPLGKYGIDYTASSLVGDASRVVTSGFAFGFHGDNQEEINFFGSSRETLVLNILGDSKEEHNELFRAFQGLLSRKDFTIVTAPQRSPLAAGSGRSARTFDVSNDLQRTALFRAIGSAAVERINERTSRVTWVLENINGFYRSVATYQSAVATITGPSQVVSISDVAGDSTAPLTSGLVRVKGPITAGGYVRVHDANSSKGLGFKPTANLLATEYVLIDLETMKATKVTSNVWTGGTDITPRVELMGEGAPSFEPGAPTVTFPATSFAYSARIESSGITNGSTAVEFSLRRSYLS